MGSILTRMDAGVAGEITRPQDAVVESALFDTANVPAAYGLPVKMVSGKIRTIAASDAASVFYGILTRQAPSIAGDTAQTFASATPKADAVQGVLVRGYCNVVCVIGTPVRNGTVYMRVVTAGQNVVGQLEATADGANNVALTGVVWAADGKDASNNAEIRIK